MATYEKIMDDPALDCKEKLTLIVLLNNNSISYSCLAKKVGVNRGTAIRTVKSLEDKGRVRCYTSGAPATNQYYVMI